MILTGVTFLDHTADVGMDVEAGSLHQLFHRAARAMLALLRGVEEDEDGGDAGDVGEPAGDPVHVALRAEDPVELLAAWLRELLYLHEVKGVDYVALQADHLDAGRLAGRVLTRPGGRAVREIKGVTYHALAVTEAGGRWRARVIFDV